MGIHVLYFVAIFISDFRGRETNLFASLGRGPKRLRSSGLLVKMPERAVILLL
jgi:hypothetical protein